MLLWVVLSLLGLAKDAKKGVPNPRPEDKALVDLRERVEHEDAENYTKFELLEKCLGITLNNPDDHATNTNDEEVADEAHSIGSFADG